MARTLIIVLTISLYSNLFSYGFRFYHSPLTNHVISRSKLYISTLPSPSTGPIKEDDNDISINTIIDVDTDNIDDVRRVRSLARRDRLAQWRATVTENEEEVRETKDNYFLLAAFLPTLIAFLSWEKISFGLSELLDMFGVINTESGNVFANNLLRPTITGKSAFVLFCYMNSCVEHEVSVN